MSLRDDFLSALRSQIGAPYKWSGQSPSDGFDCSGLVVWGLGQAGMTLEDMTADNLAEHFHHNKKIQDLSVPGDLWFYGGDAMHITHVMVLNKIWCKIGYDIIGTLIGARGGGYSVNTPMDAWQNKAYVDVVTSDYWSYRLQFVRGID